MTHGTKRTDELTIVIPAKNEASTLPKLLFANTMLHTWDEEYLLRDQGYWEEA